MLSSTKKPTTKWAETTDEFSAAEFIKRKNLAIKRMVDRIVTEGADDFEVLMFSSTLENLAALDFISVHAIFWQSRRAAQAAARTELMNFFCASALLAIFMPQYFMFVLVIWGASLVKYFTAYRRVLRRLIMTGIMYLGGGAVLLHAAYNLFFQ